MHCFNEPHYIVTIATRGATIASPNSCRQRGGRCALRRESASPFIQARGWVSPARMRQWHATLLFQTSTLLVTDVPTGQSKHIVTEASIADSAMDRSLGSLLLVNSTTSSRGCYPPACLRRGGVRHVVWAADYGPSACSVCVRQSLLRCGQKPLGRDSRSSEYRKAPHLGRHGEGGSERGGSRRRRTYGGFERNAHVGRRAKSLSSSPLSRA